MKNDYQAEPRNLPFNHHHAKVEHGAAFNTLTMSLSLEKYQMTVFSKAFGWKAGWKVIACIFAHACTHCPFTRIFPRHLVCECV